METRETLTISLPPALREKVDTLVAAGDYGSVSEYLRELVRADLKRRAGDELEKRLLESMNSGPSTPMTKDDWNGVRRAIREQAAKRIRNKAG